MGQNFGPLLKLTHHAESAHKSPLPYPRVEILHIPFNLQINIWRLIKIRHCARFDFEK